MNTNIIDINDLNILELVKKLQTKSFVMAIPTDTVYALCCNANDDMAIEKIYNIKKRDKNKPISLFVKNKNEIYKYIDCEINDKISELLDKYWPGQLTVIFKKKKNIFDNLTSKKDTIGIRVPNDKTLLSILNNIDFPLAQTSCNLSGEKEITTAKEIYNKLHNSIDMIIDEKKIASTNPSTIISISNQGINILRQGNVIIDDYYKN